MSLYVLFGLPGTGKTFVGEVFKKHFKFYFYDGDSDLPEDMKKAIASETKISDSMRDVFFARIIQRIKELKSTYPNIVVAQTFIKEKYRKNLLREIPDAQFILISTDTSLREKRLASRTHDPLNLEYARHMCKIFEEPKIAHHVITNNEDGAEAVKQQIAEIVK